MFGLSCSQEFEVILRDTFASFMSGWLAGIVDFLNLTYIAIIQNRSIYKPCSNCLAYNFAGN